MGFFERLHRRIKKIKNKLIVYAILVLIVIVVLVAPLAVSVVDAQNASGVHFTQAPFDTDFWQVLISSMSTGILKPMDQIGKCSTPDYIGTFLTNR